MNNYKANELNKLCVGDTVKFTKKTIKWELTNFNDCHSFNDTFNFDAVKQYAFWKGLAAGIPTKAVVVSYGEGQRGSSVAVCVASVNKMGSCVAYYCEKDLKLLKSKKRAKK